MSFELRRHSRIALRSPVRVTWQDRHGNSKFALARTLDISEAGIRVELPEAIEPQRSLGIQSDRLGLSCSGLVRNCVRCGAKYLVGIEFSGTVRMNHAANALLTNPEVSMEAR